MSIFLRVFLFCPFVVEEDVRLFLPLERVATDFFFLFVFRRLFPPVPNCFFTVLPAALLIAFLKCEGGSCPVTRSRTSGSKLTANSFPTLLAEGNTYFEKIGSA